MSIFTYEPYLLFVLDLQHSFPFFRKIISCRTEASEKEPEREREEKRETETATVTERKKRRETHIDRLFKMIERASVSTYGAYSFVFRFVSCHRREFLHEFQSTRKCVNHKVANVTECICFGTVNICFSCWHRSPLFRTYLSGAFVQTHRHTSIDNAFVLAVLFRIARTGQAILCALVAVV